VDKFGLPTVKSIILKFFQGNILKCPNDPQNDLVGKSRFSVSLEPICQFLLFLRKISLEKWHDIFTRNYLERLMFPVNNQT
jgi:hypothetical protein